MTPERYAVVVEEGADWPPEEIEREYLGYTSSEVGERVLAAWHVPPSITHGATYATRIEAIPDNAPREWRDLAAVTRLAVYAAEVIFSDEPARACAA